MSDNRSGYIGDLANWGRGLCMGAADIVPGVSGGTMALILGHYQRLVEAIGRFDRELVRMLMKRQLVGAWKHIDGRFLLALAVGIATGVVALASLMQFLLEYQQAFTYAAFTGLILASSWLVSLRMGKWKPAHLPVALLGLGLALTICLLKPAHSELTPLSGFLAAMIAICAMILPGISGAFVLLLFGLYHPVTEIIKGLPKGEIELQGLINLAAVAAGCAVGLLAFTRILRWLLHHHHDGTMAFLVGLMIGSLYKLWPFQRASDETADLEFKFREFELYWPQSSTELLTAVGVAVVAFAGTIALEKIGSAIASKEEANAANAVEGINEKQA